MNVTEISKGGIFGIRSTEISKGIGTCNSNTAAILRFTIRDKSNRLIITTDHTTTTFFTVMHHPMHLYQSRPLVHLELEVRRP
jgi:hypothetical protein